MTTMNKVSTQFYLQWDRACIYYIDQFYVQNKYERKNTRLLLEFNHGIYHIVPFLCITKMIYIYIFKGFSFSLPSAATIRNWCFFFGWFLLEK